jgi:hypothetical protein
MPTAANGTPSGWSLHFAGADTTGMLVESVMEEVGSLVGGGRGYGEPMPQV